MMRSGEEKYKNQQLLMGGKRKGEVITTCGGLGGGIPALVPTVLAAKSTSTGDDYTPWREYVITNDDAWEKVISKAHFKQQCIHLPLLAPAARATPVCSTETQLHLD